MASADTTIGRLRARTVPALTFERGAAISLGLLWLVIATGGLVRLTASGLGCTDWPNCEEGRLVPAGSYHAVIEYSNRIISGVAVVAAVVVAVLGTRVTGLDRATRLGAIAVAVAALAQGPLGAITVATDLHPVAVMSHFLLAIATLALAAWVAFRARRVREHGQVDLRPRSRPAVAAWAAVVSCLALVTTGAFVTAAGPHPGSTDKLIDRLGDFDTAAWVHVRAAVTFTAILAGLTVWLWRARRGTPAQRLAIAGLVLTACQLGVGEYQYRNGLPWGVIAVHVSIAATLVIAVIVLACLVSEGSPERG